MTENEVDIAREVIAGYEPWKTAKAKRFTDFTVSAYHDELATLKQIEAYEQIHAFAEDPENGDEDTGYMVRRILGLA